MLLCKKEIALAEGVYFHFTSSALWISPKTTSGDVNSGEQVILLYSISILPVLSYDAQAKNREGPKKRPIRLHYMVHIKW